MGLKELFLNKGGAGVSMSRRDTVERLNPLLRRAYELLYLWRAAADASDRGAAERLEAMLKTQRADIGKLAETVLSCGGAPYNGAGLRDDAPEGAARLQNAEEGFRALLKDELKQNHQIRTRAVLNVLADNSDARLDYLRGQKTP